MGQTAPMVGSGERGGSPGATGTDPVILTPDQRVRVFVSSTMEELAAERTAVRRAIEDLRLAPVLFELGARPHPPRSLYRSYLSQSHVFLGIYWQRYGWVAPGMDVSGLEDEHLMAGAKPRLIYVKRPAPDREHRLEALLDRIRSSGDASYKSFSDADELERIVADDLALLLSEAFLFDLDAEPPRRPRLTLPADVSTFVGREDDLDRLRALLARDEVRLVTLTGPGGIGKSRLALRIASELASDFEEGAAFVPLASLTDPELVPAAIAAAIGLRDTGAASVRDALANDLAGRSLLLVVDNLEHLLPAAGLLAELLASSTRLKVLVTSRAALRLRGEHEVPVPPLAAADSLRLFEERAAEASGSLEADAGEAATVAAICERLEHIPLAIELAAARSRVLPPRALLERLDRRLRLLVSGARDLPERQRTLRSTIQWSHDLLTDEEQHLFATLGAFVGGFSLTAVEATHVGRGSADVLELLASLVDKSLLRAEPTAGEPRFRMLEMIGEYALERLDESGEAQEVRDRHAAFYRALSVAVGDEVRGPRQAEWLRRLGGDTGDADNLRAALAWLLRRGRLDEVAQMAWALWVPAWLSGRLDEGAHTANAALAAHGEMSDLSRARLVLVAGLFAMWRGRHADTVPLLREATALGRRLGDEEIVAWATVASAMSAGSLEGEERAEELATEAVQLCQGLGDPWAETAALNVLGWLYVGQERFEGTDAVFEATLSTALAAGDDHFAAMAEVNLAEHRMHAGDLGAAEALLASSVARYREQRFTYSAAYLLDAAARLALQRGDPARAVRLLGAATHQREAIGVAVWGSQLARRGALVDRLRSTLGEPAFTEASEAGGRLDYADALDEAVRHG